MCSVTGNSPATAAEDLQEERSVVPCEAMMMKSYEALSEATTVEKLDRSEVMMAEMSVVPSEVMWTL